MRTQHSYYYIFMYTPIDYLNYGIYLQQHNPLFLMRYNSIYIVWHLHTAKPYFVSKRPEPLNPPTLYFLYTLIHPARSNTLAARVLGLGVP